MNNIYIIFPIIIFSIFGIYRDANAVSITPMSVQQSGIITQPKLVNELQFGSRGDNVIILQKILSSITNIYPEKFITGYYGNLTKKAVERFQDKNKLNITGVLDKETLNKINEFRGTTVDKAPALSAITTTIVSPTSSMISWKTDQFTISEVYYSLILLSDSGSKLVVKDPTPSLSHTIEITHLDPATRYYYAITSINPKTTSKSTIFGEFTTKAL